MQVVPQLGDPVQHAEEGLVAGGVVDLLLLLGLHRLPVQVPDQEAIGGLHVVGEGHHPGDAQGGGR